MTAPSVSQGAAPARTVAAPPTTARLHACRLDLDLTVSEVVRRLAHRDRVTAWSGTWSHGAVVTCDPEFAVRLGIDEAMALVTRQPVVRGSRRGAVGGGWFGYFAYRDDHALSSWGWYPDVLHFDGSTWWYEALLTREFDRAAADRRRTGLVADLHIDRAHPPARLAMTRWPTPASHLSAVERCQHEIRSGEIYQANVATRIEMHLTGSVHDAWAQLVEHLDPARAALVADPVLGLVGAGPELFLSRSGRAVRTEPIKGTRPRTGGPDDSAELSRLRQSEKDTAENVMIVDLMRNDLGRVCTPGTVRVPRLLEIRAAPGVWHLVSAVCGELADGRDDADLLAATFPPGSVTGAPKLRATEVIDAVEDRPRGLFTGAAGYASPLAGLELAVTIRSIEVAPDGSAQLGVGGGITVDSSPDQEWRECLDKAAPVLRVLGAATALPDRAPAPPGLFEMLLVVDGRPRRLAAHAGRLRRSYWECYGMPLTADIAAAIDAVVLPGVRHQRVRVDASPDRPDRVGVLATVCAPPVPLAQQRGVALVRRCADAGQGHNTIDRTRLEAAERGLPPGVCAVLIGPGELVWETTRSNVFVVCAGEVRTPPLDGNILPGTARQDLLDRLADAGVPYRITAVTTAEAAAAEGMFVTDAVRGLRWVRAFGTAASWAAPHPVLDGIDAW